MDRTLVTLQTERLLMRQWRDTDREPFAAINADPEVMAHYPAPMTREQSDAALAKLAAGIDATGIGLWALERRDDSALLGFVGIRNVPFEAHFTPAVEVGWRLRRDTWGSGYATEAAQECVRYGFETLGLEQIIAMARPDNWPSRRVMDRLGMWHDEAGTFRYPPAGEPGSSDYVLYRLDAAR